MRRRAVILLCAVGLMLSGLLYRLYTIVRERPAQVAAMQSTWTVAVARTRGTIYDAVMRPIVNQHKQYRAAMIPDELLLARMRPVTAATDFEVLKKQLESGAPAAVRMISPVGYADGLAQFFVTERYGDRLAAPHVIGYLDNSGEHGVSGIELACDDLLNEYAGQAAAVFSVDGSGACLTGISPRIVNTTARSAGGVILTIDSEIQIAVEDLAAKYLTAGAVIVLEPYTGEIVAMASQPTFQPDTVASSIDENNGALINRALSLYDCGSVFKIVTAAAALENGLSPETIFRCDGSLEVGGVNFHCHQRLGHGNLDMTTAFASSCNIYFIRLAQCLGGGALNAMANNFGFGRAITLGDGLAAARGLLPNTEDLLLSDAALANYSFGQGYLMATPLHIAQMVATVVNGGAMPPLHLIKGYIDDAGNCTDAPLSDGYQVISPQTAKKLMQMMVATVADGTGKNAAPTLCSGAGKTGTAETGQISVYGDKPVVQSWFAGYFPAESPRYVVTILGEDADNTDAQTAKLFCEISDKLYEMTE